MSKTTKITRYIPDIELLAEQQGTIDALRDENARLRAGRGFKQLKEAVDIRDAAQAVAADAQSYYEGEVRVKEGLVDDLQEALGIGSIGNE